MGQAFGLPRTKSTYGYQEGSEAASQGSSNGATMSPTILP
jgi:hypothetical protein